MIWDRRCKNLSTEGVFISGFSGIAAPYWISGFEDINAILQHHSTPTEVAKIFSISRPKATQSATSA